MKRIAIALLILFLYCPGASSQIVTAPGLEIENTFEDSQTFNGVKIEWSASVPAGGYNAGDIVSYMGALYQSIAGGNLNHTPTDTMYWTPVSSPGGGGGFANVTTVAYSATPTFTITGNDVFKMTLTGNITSMTLSGTPAAGWKEQFRFVTDATANRIVTWPASFTQKPAVATDAGAITIVDVVYDGTNWVVTNVEHPVAVTRFVSTSGNDSNNGMTWGTAKLTLVGAAQSCYGGTTSPYLSVGGPNTGGAYCTIFFEHNSRANPAGTQYGYWVMGPDDPWALANGAAYAAGTLPTGWMKGGTFTTQLIGAGCTEGTSNSVRTTCGVIGGTGQKGFPLIWISRLDGLSISNMKGNQAYIGIASDLTRSVSGPGGGGTANIFLSNNAFGGGGNVLSGNGATPGIDIGANSFWIWIQDGVAQTANNSASISALVRTSEVTTATTVAAHAFIVGDTFTILDALDDTFNSIKGNNGGTSFTVATVTDNTHFTFAQAGKANLTVGAGGTAFNDSQYCVRMTSPGLIFIEDLQCNGGGYGIFGTDVGNVHMANTTLEGDFSTPTTPLLMIQGSISGAIDITGGGLSDTLTQSRVVVVNSANSPYLADKIIVSGLALGESRGPMTVIGSYNTSGSKQNPFVEGQVGFTRGRSMAIPVDDFHSAPTFVRFPNLIGASGTWSVVNTAPCATATITPGIADPDGGTNAYHVAATTADCQAELRFYNTSTTISTGDLFIIKIRVRGTAAAGINGAGADIWNVRGIENQPLSIFWETAAFNVGDGDWQTITGVYKIGTVTAGAIDPDISLAFKTENPLDFYMPYAAFIVSGVISDSEAINVATTLRPYPSTCTVGQLCTANGVVAGGVPTTITVADTTDTTSVCALFESATGDLGPKTDAGCTYNAATGVLTVTGLAGSLAGATGLPLTTGVTGSLPHANIAATAVTPGSYTNANITIAADGSVTAAANGSGIGNRFTAGGDPIVAGDIALGAGWGSTAAVSAVTGHDQAFNFTVTTGGTGIAANPTFTMTFTDGTWTLSPVFICTQTGGNDTLSDVTFTNGVTTATTIPGIWNGTPTTAKTYIITCIGVGR